MEHNYSTVPKTWFAMKMFGRQVKRKEREAREEMSFVLLFFFYLRLSWSPPPPLLHLIKGSSYCYCEEGISEEKVETFCITIRVGENMIGSLSFSCCLTFILSFTPLSLSFRR